MTTRAAFTLTMSALLLGGTMVGCTAQHGGVAGMSEAAQGRASQLASESAAQARAALARHRNAAAVDAAEDAVRWQPQDAGYRALLGQSYLAAGRFESARDALTDALTLAPADGHVALNLALAQTGTGDWNGARKTLAAHIAEIPAADLGLAVALAGDPASAVQILTQAARAPGADAKTRQNLALALALSGRWTESRAVAALDLGADQIDHRMEEWAAFAYPKAASDQVASLLGVTPVVDHGQPAALALNMAVPAAPRASEAVAAEVAPVEAAPADPKPAQVADATPVPPAPVEIAAPAAPEVAVVAANPVADARPTVTFGPRREVVQAIPAATHAPVPAKAAVKVAMVRETPAVSFAKGDFYVQIGAYDNAAVAHDGWMRATRRYRSLAELTPLGMDVTSNGSTYYRLSVGGFARNDAVAMCRTYRAKGGICFVRAGEGEQVAQWIKPGREQLASR